MFEVGTSSWQKPKYYSAGPERIAINAKDSKNKTGGKKK